MVRSTVADLVSLTFGHTVTALEIEDSLMMAPLS